MIEGQEEYEVESIVGHRQFGRGKKLHYLIKWKGYPASDNTWEPEEDVHAPDLILRYRQQSGQQDSRQQLARQQESPAEPSGIKRVLEPRNNAQHPHYPSTLANGDFYLLYSALGVDKQFKPTHVALLFRPAPYTTHKFHEFKPKQRAHTTFVHSLQHWYFCKERFCRYHDKH
jgi:hypothetical protein